MPTYGEVRPSDFKPPITITITITIRSVVRSSIVIVIGGLESRGLTNHMYKKIPPVGTPTTGIPGLSIFKRGPYSPSLLNQNVRSALCRAPLSSQPTSFIRSGYEWAVYGRDHPQP